MKKTPIQTMFAAFAAVSLLATGPALAQTYPNQQIKIIVPFTPATGMDIIARTVGPKLSERLGQPVVVENRPGASGNIGADLVAKAAPDGYTLMVSANTMLIAANMYKNVPYQPLEDFAPVSLAAWGTLLLVANPKSNIASVADFVAKAKAEPGKLTYSSPGIGTPHHMSMELFKDRAGIDVLHVPYRGSSGALTDLLSGEVHVGFVPVHVAMPLITSGRLRPLAAGSPKRHPNAPDIATLGELGYPNLNVEMLYGFFAPKSTPSSVVTRLNTELRAILAERDVNSAFDKVGLDVAASSQEELQALMRRDFPRWGEIIKKNGISAE